jgi:cation transport regulator ChaB
MKKLVLMMVGLLLISGSALAQDKEALKAQKAAMKEAESTLKKAKSTFEMSIPNAQYGRKETDFEKLATARELAESAVANQYTKDNAEAWKVAADIAFEYFKKQDNEVKADPENEQLKKNFLEESLKLLNYCQKYDSLIVLDPKAKPEEVAKNHQTYQVIGVNIATQVLQASQNYSNSDAPEDLKKGAQYSELFLNTMQKSHLMKDFKHESLADWITYAKAFRAQSYYNIPGTSEEKIIAVYKDLMDTKYKGVAYQSLSNYYRDKDAVKQNQYLQEGIEALKNDPEQRDLRANFALILMQNLYTKGDKEGFKKAAQTVKEEFSDVDGAINAYLMEGQIAFEDKDYLGAKAIFLAAKEKFPDDPKCLLMAARSAWMQAMTNGSKKEDLDEALRLFKQLETENPDDPDLWGESLYVLYNNTQQTAEAAKYKKYYKDAK